MNHATAFVREKQIYTSQRPGERMKEAEIYVQTEGRKAYYKAGRRRKRKKMSSPAQAALNDRRSKIYFDRLVNTNFGKGDYHVSLTYDDANLPATVEEAEKNMRRFIERLKKLYKNAGLKLRYIYVTSFRTDKIGAPVRMHHHVILCGGVDRDSIEDLWRAKSKRLCKLGERLGFVNCDRLQPDDNGLSALCAYLCKQPREGIARRWHASVGLKKPMELEPNDDKYDFADLKQIVADNADAPNVTYWERQYPGWTLQSDPQYAYTVSQSEFSGASIRVKLRRLSDAEMLARKQSRKKRRG